MSRRCNLTTAIPFVNAPPHLGFALELVQADVLARHLRQRGWDVRFQTGTDDNSLKNVHAAERAGVPVRRFVDRHAEAYAELRHHLGLSFDDFIRTSSDPRHRAGVDRLWRACDAGGDLYRKHYEGLYCVGCEQFYAPTELTDRGDCPEHRVPPQPVAEENWFFRLSRYEGAVRDAIESGRLRIWPDSRRNEALAFIAQGLDDFSVSRSADRSRGWGIPVPDDPTQVVYVWFDALANYLTALDYGETDALDHRRWWLDSDRRVHLIGKGILRFHAVYWPAILLAAGQPLPTDIVVHDYLTVNGHKLGKSLGNAVDPVQLVRRFGVDAVRWWLVREVPRSGDVDFTVDRLVARSNDDLANGIGNLASRVASVVHLYRGGGVTIGALHETIGALQHEENRALQRSDGALQLAQNGALQSVDRRLLIRCSTLSGDIARSLQEFDIRSAATAIVDTVDETNRYIETVRPWELARAEAAGEPAAARRLDTALGLLVHACRTIATELQPFVPALAERLGTQFGGVGAERVRPPVRLVERIGV